MKCKNKSWIGESNELTPNKYIKYNFVSVTLKLLNVTDGLKLPN